MLDDKINILDIFMVIIFIIIIFYLANLYKNYKIKKHNEYKYFIWALSTKIIGAVLLALIYVYYYEGGDTLEYYLGATNLSNLLFEKPSEYFNLLIYSRDNIPTSLTNTIHSITYYKSNESWFMIKITSIISLFSFNRFLMSSIFFALLAFSGGWKLFKTFLFFFPKYHKAAFISVFLPPSIIIWSSGILKDTVTFAALGFFFFHITQTFFNKKKSILSFLHILLAGYIIFTLKAYIIIGFLPAIFITIYIYNKNKIKNQLLKKLISPIILLLFLFLGYFFINNISKQSDKYNVSGLEKRAQGFHSWHSVRRGSSYNLGNIEYTPIGVLKKVPSSLNVTFFRPYLWEVRSITTLPNAIESLLLLLLFIYVLFKYRFKFLYISFNNSFLTLCIIYSVIFGFAVGFTSYNFGALARYKVPVIPFFVFLLLYFYYTSKTKSQEPN